MSRLKWDFWDGQWFWLLCNHLVWKCWVCFVMYRAFTVFHYKVAYKTLLSFLEKQEVHLMALMAYQNVHKVGRASNRMDSRVQSLNSLILDRLLCLTGLSSCPWGGAFFAQPTVTVIHITGWWELVIQGDQVFLSWFLVCLECDTLIIDPNH